MTDEAADAEALAGHARSLADAVDAAVPGWVSRGVIGRWEQWSGEPAPPDLLAAARAAGERAGAAVAPRLRALLDTDVDEQRSNPLAILREAVRFATEALWSAGVPPVERDADATRLFPDDVYDLTPGSFADVDPSLHEPGITWGAAKAHVVLSRRRREGRRPSS